MTLEALMSLAAVPTPCVNGAKRHRAEAEGGKQNSKGNVVEKSIAMLDARLRVVESFTEEVFLIPASTTLSAALLQAMATWNSRRPESGPHPDGAARLTVAAALLTFITKHAPMASTGPMAEQAASQVSSLQGLSGSINQYNDLEQHVTMCMAKMTKKADQVLLKFTWARYSSLNQSMQLQLSVLAALGAIHQSGPAPKGFLVRQLG